MHNHNNNDSGGGHKGMLWMMIPCLLLLGFLFFGGGKFSSGGYLLWIMIGVCVVPHIWMMFRGHGKHEDADTEKKVDDASTKQPGMKDEHKHGGCCH